MTTTQTQAGKLITRRAIWKGIVESAVLRAYKAQGEADANAPLVMGAIKTGPGLWEVEAEDYLIPDLSPLTYGEAMRRAVTSAEGKQWAEAVYWLEEARQIVKDWPVIGDDTRPTLRDSRWHRLTWLIGDFCDLAQHVKRGWRYR